ncbi:hypothetical protein ALP26_02856 [Pseudomonas savastanoi pv. glycinea]|nr:hypothetical protein ALP26_02856 [Pseudomonas savastanoi pv. glycinea]
MMTADQTACHVWRDQPDKTHRSDDAHAQAGQQHGTAHRQPARTFEAGTQALRCFIAQADQVQRFGQQQAERDQQQKRRGQPHMVPVTAPQTAGQGQQGGIDIQRVGQNQKFGDARQRHCNRYPGERETHARELHAGVVQRQQQCPRCTAQTRHKRQRGHRQLRQADNRDGQRQPCALGHAKNFRRGQRVANHTLHDGTRQAERAAGHDCDQSAWQAVIPDFEVLAVVGDQMIKHRAGRQPDGARA